MHNSLSIALSESVIELVTIVLGQVITRKWLSTVLVDTLEDLFLR